ncbi:hypothetical protein GCM10023087_07380 [Microbacterium rhizosphaerae]
MRELMKHELLLMKDGLATRVHDHVLVIADEEHSAHSAFVGEFGQLHHSKGPLSVSLNSGNKLIKAECGPQAEVRYCRRRSRVDTHVITSLGTAVIAQPTARSLGALQSLVEETTDGLKRFG